MTWKNPIFLSALLVFGCASQSDVLKPVTNDPVAVEPQKAVPSTPTATFETLTQLLKGLGYEGIGLQYESDEMLNVLIQVFQDPKSAKRQLKLIYTGLSLSYDSNAKSLTIGGTKDQKTILDFLQKNVPFVR